MQTQNKLSSSKQKSKNRWHLSAEGFLLLPSALRPHLSRFILILLLLLSFSLAAETFWLTDEVSAASIELTVPANYTIELNPGTGTTFGESKNQPISIKTSGSFGYTLNIKLGDGTNLKNGSNVIKTITKPDGYESSDAYKSSNEINTWAYKPGKLNSTSNTKYLPFPSAETLLEKTDKNNDTANNYDFTIAAKVDNTLPSGTYSNNFTFTAVANTVSYTINYNLNSGSWTGSSPQSGSTTDKTVTISNVSPTKSNYEFKGWCTVQPTNNDSTSPTCSGTTINPSGNYTLSNGVNNVTLYAMWKSTMPAAVDKGSLGTMQNFNCDSSLPNIHEYGTVTDSRDNNTYKVAKLMDGKCWMVENLRLGDSKLSNRTLTSANTDITASTYELTAQTPVNFDDSGHGGYDADALYIDPNHPEYGGYYSWHTATAGTGSVSMSKRGENATSSICPKGWKLPTGDSGGDFKNLVWAYGNSSTDTKNLRATPVPGFVNSGLVWNNGDGLANQGSYGHYWSSTVRDAGKAFYLNLSSSIANSAYSGYSDSKFRGDSVRCVVAP